LGVLDMYLRDLAVCASWHPPANEHDELRGLFDRTSHVVVESVLAWIPYRAVVLDNLAKLNVAVGDPKGFDVRYDKWQGVGTFYVETFDFQGYASKSSADRQSSILELLHTAFSYVGGVSGSDFCQCVKAAEKVRSFGLPLPALDSEAFWLSMPPNKIRSKSFRENIEFLARLGC
jgi:hypothetical protein